MDIKHSNEKFCELGLAVIKTEAESIANLAERINDQFAAACRLLLACQGRIIVLGMGKSGHIGNKIAATLASTGSPAFFVHPAEASHGDFGMITDKDVVLALSNCGETAEILIILPLIKRLGIPLITLTGNPHSMLAQTADINLNVSVAKEACPLGLAPTSSTAAMLAMGDALAIALLEARGFTVEDFAFAHPGGNLGRRLLLRIQDVMRTGDAIPRIPTGTPISHALVEMSQKGMGMTTIVSQAGELLGIFTDGDLRRALDNNIDIHKTNIDTAMHTHCKTISAQILAAEALRIMEAFKITSLVIVDDKNILQGAVHMHDILRAGIA